MVCSVVSMGQTVFLRLSWLGHLWRTCSAVWFSCPQEHRGEGTSFSFVAMWWLSLLWPERSRSRMTCSSLRSWWKSSFSTQVLVPVLMIVFFSSKLRQVSNCFCCAPCFASSSAFSLPGIPQWEGIHCSATRLLLATSCSSCCSSVSLPAVSA